MRAPRHIRIWSTRRLAVVAAALVALPTSGPAALVSAEPVSAAQLEDKRKEAQRLAQELEEQGRRESLLAEELAVASLHAERIAAEVHAAERQVRETDRRLLEVRARLTGHAVDAYVRGGQLPVIQLMVAGSDDEMAVRATYVKQVAGKERGALDDLSIARGELAERRSRLREVQSTAREALARVEARKRSAAEATDARRATLARVQGELTALVEAEERRRSEEEESRARAQLAARQAREEASLRTRTNVRPGSGLDLEASTSTGPPASGAAAAVAEAKRQLGKPYQWGAAGPDSFDCSGLTLWAWKAGGRSLPHSSRAQYSATARVPLSQIQPGDLVFFGDPIHHMGIYVGDGTMVEASQTGTPVRYRSIYRSDMAGVGRVH